MPYRIERADGKVVTGRTNKDGLTKRVKTKDAVNLKLYWLPDTSQAACAVEDTAEGCA